MRGKEFQNDSYAKKMVLGIGASCVAETATFPLDIVATRLSIQGEGARSTPYRGMIGTTVGIVREEGALQLWRGLTPAVLRHVVYSGLRMPIYEITRDKILKKNEDGSFPLFKAVIAGMLSGALAQFIASPTDLVKVQMQMEGRRLLQGKPALYKGTWDAFVTIFRANGTRGLWKGCVPNMQRAALVNLGDLTTYDTTKHLLLIHSSLQDNYVTHAISSLVAGLVAATLGTPANVIKSRIMHGGVVYKSSWHCLVQTIEQEGVRSLWKGFLPTWLRMAPWSMTFWLTYEQVRKLVGAHSF
eukprot:m.218217 g.218217  ORF g.218217 m.218217 type:complete len:300 (+) comp54115_c0_seq3:20-919(+)